MGGARNHRHGLDSGVMLKENHLRSSLLDAPSTIDYIKKRAPILLQTEVEVSTLDGFLVALNSLAPVIMLDNFSFEDVLNAVEIRNQKAPQTRIEVSGNLDRWPKEKLAHCGADYASMGSLIYKAPWADLSLQIFNRDADI